MLTDPFAHFEEWYAEAQEDPPMDPAAVALASATSDGRPSVRMVLYRGIREGGFSFFTNYESRKGLELASNPVGAMVFYWPHLGRQVRIEGSVERLSPAESDFYFRSRPRESQITAVASRQSRPLTDESAFLQQIAELEDSSREKEISRPEQWGGYKIIPIVFEFWTHREHRRHERILYRKVGAAWTLMRLYP